MSRAEHGNQPNWICENCPMVEECSTSILKACPEKIARKGLRVNTKSPQTPSRQTLEREHDAGTRKLEAIKAKRIATEKYLENTSQTEAPEEPRINRPPRKVASRPLPKTSTHREKTNNPPKKVHKTSERSPGGMGKLISAGVILSVAVAAYLSKADDIKASDIFDAARGIGKDIPTQPAYGPIVENPTPDSFLPNIFQAESSSSQTLAPFFYEVPVGQWEAKIIQYSSQFPNINPNMVATTVTIESCGNPNAVSGGGALGLGQLMQSTFPEYTKQQLLDPDTNLFLTAQYISQLMTSSGGNFQAALAGYNGGPEALKWISGQSTRDNYIHFLMGHKSGIWNTYEKANRKAVEVERMVELSYMYNDAMSGSRATFDAMQASGRCIR